MRDIERKEEGFLKLQRFIVIDFGWRAAAVLAIRRVQQQQQVNARLKQNDAGMLKAISAVRFKFYGCVMFLCATQHPYGFRTLLGSYLPPSPPSPPPSLTPAKRCLFCSRHTRDNYYKACFRALSNDNITACDESFHKSS